MKKIFLTICATVALLSCAKELQGPAIIDEPIEQRQDAQSLAFDLKINHASLDDVATKAVKMGWETGDKVFIFFSTIAAPKHVEMTYDGTSWVSKEITMGTTEGSIGLSESGTMTAVYLPFGNGAIVEEKSDRFSFDQTNFSYYLSCVKAPYTLTGSIVSGTLDMTVPDGFVQFFFTDATATDSGALLREAHITPKTVTGVNTDGSLIIESKEMGTQMPGFVYGKGEEKGYLFSGELTAAARGVSTDYHFNMVVGAISKVLEGTKTLHSGASGNYAHRAIKFPALAAWASGNKENIEFADANIKAKVVAAFDTNGDGELSYTEAAVATTIKDVFGTEKNYTSFNEFQFFTGVTRILSSQFLEWSLKSIVLPSKLERIQYAAFKNCSNLTSIVIPDSVTDIDQSVFYGCSSLTSVVIPKDITRINSQTFYGCSSLKSIILPNGLTSIGTYAFDGCSTLGAIVIPDSVTSIESYAFSDCSSLTSIVIPDSVTSIGNGAFSGCSSLTSIDIPNSVTSIGNSTFNRCSSLTSIAIPEGVTSIGESAFSDCSSLASVILPKSITSISASTFKGCSSLTSFNIPEGVTSIGESAFSDCSSLTSIDIPDSVTSIGNSAFNGCSSLTSIDIPEKVTSIGSYAFSSCSSLISVTLSNGLTSIEDSTFRGCNSLESITIPDSITSIGAHAFYGCSSLTSVTLPNDLKSIHQFAFDFCSALVSIVIPNSITSIGAFAFYGCSSLTSVTILATVVPSGGTTMFSSSTYIYVPEDFVEEYKSADYWSTYANRIMPILAEGDDPEILSEVSARYTGGSIVSINGVIQQNSRLNFFVYNNSSKAIKVLTVQLIDGVTGKLGNMMSVNAEISPSSNSGWTLTIGAGGIQSPIANFVFSCEGKRYEISAPYQE